MNRACCLAFSVCFILPSPARAQSATRSEPITLVGGLSYGVGDTRFRPEGFEIVAAGPAGTAAVPGHERGVARLAFFGVLVRRWVAIVFDSDFTGAGASRISSRLVTVGARCRPASRVWIGGGAGVGSLRYEPDSQSRAVRLERGLALSAAAGIELVRWRLFALDLQARVSTATFGQLRVIRTAIQLGYEVSVPLR